MCFGTWTAYKKAGTGTRRLLRAIKSARWNGHEPRGAAVIQAGEQLLRRPLLKLGQRGQAASTGGVLVAGCARHKLDVAVCGGGVRAWRRACLAAGAAVAPRPRLSHRRARAWYYPWPWSRVVDPMIYAPG